MPGYSPPVAALKEPLWLAGAGAGRLWGSPALGLASAHTPF